MQNPPGESEGAGKVRRLFPAELQLRMAPPALFAIVVHAACGATRLRARCEEDREAPTILAVLGSPGVLGVAVGAVAVWRAWAERPTCADARRRAAPHTHVVESVSEAIVTADRGAVVVATNPDVRLRQVA